MTRRQFAIASLLTALLGLPFPWGASPSARGDQGVPQPASVAFLGSIQTPEGLQRFLDDAIDELLAADALLRDQSIHVTVLDLPTGGVPALAHRAGDTPVYPASVVKFVYLMAAYEWRDRGELEIDRELDNHLRNMIYVSSNQATQHVMRRLTDTEAGPRLSAAEYGEFRDRRHRVKRWLERLGIRDLHAVHPTYDGGGDLFGRDVQFLQDGSVSGALPHRNEDYKNRQAMTANATARLLALLATDRALAPESSSEVRRRMHRDPRKQPYLAKRIAGGADARSDLEVYSKTGTWGPIFADAGVVRHESGHQVVVVAFLDGRPAYRGSFIAQLTRRVVRRLLPAPQSRKSSFRSTS